MANPGVGPKFVSVNLNKSYGQQQYHHNNQHHSSSYGLNRTRPGGGGGGGMVVLSRPRSSQKAAGSKLSVPPPLNLPSRRKEHERFDSLGPGGGPAGGGLGSGGRPSSSGMGWTKPAAAIAMQEKEAFSMGGDHVVDGTSSSNHVDDPGLHNVVNADSKGSGSSVYMPPSARSAGAVVSSPSQTRQVMEKTTVLRGEDFPSLQATLLASSVPEKKQRDGLNQKQKQVLSEYLTSEQRDSSRLGTVEMRPQFLRNNISNALDESGGERRGLGGYAFFEKDRKQAEYFPGPLPLVRLNPRSDWEDDERDTGHGLMDRGRDYGFSNTEAFWDRDFEFPRPSILPQKPAYNFSDRRLQHDNEAGKVSSGEVTKMDTYGRDVRTSSREGPEGNLHRASKDGYGSQEVGNERNGVIVKLSGINRETTKENKYIPSSFRDAAQDDAGRRDVGYKQGGRQQVWSNTLSSFGNRAPEWNSHERYGNEQHNRHRGGMHQNSSAHKSFFSLGAKGLPVNDPILNFSREKRPFSKSEKPYSEDPFMRDFGDSGFDGRDPFSGGLVGLVKKKKDVLKQTEFHDPVRESFEAELEKVQKMQEQERQRIIEEQERAVELARREEEERMRLAREQEERQRRQEEEAREAAWRAEQERIEAMRMAEEHRIAREEEKRRIHMEEERRKQAAKQKLLELEERIAKRNAESAKAGNSASSGVTDDKMSGTLAEKDDPKVTDTGDWEDSERMVERITTSASSDSSGINRPFDIGSRTHFSRDGASAFLDRRKSVSSWKRDPFDNGNNSTFPPQDQEHGHRSPRRDAYSGGRALSRKEFYAGSGFMSSRNYEKGGIPDPHMDDFSQIRGQRWNTFVDGDYYGKNMEIESEFHENLADRFGDTGWAQSRTRSNLYPPYHERMYQNPDADSFYSFGRSRYSMRQPRVLPPPSMASVHRSSYRGENEHPGPSAFSENGMQYNHGSRIDSTMQTRYDPSQQENLGRAEIIDDAQQDNSENEGPKLDTTSARCGSQSSLSVSSPPDSPVHLSHDDLDESGDSPVLADEGKDVTLLGQGSESVGTPVESQKGSLMSGSSGVSTGDDEEWAIDNDEQLQEQEEYDEDEDGYEEEDEVHDGEDENINLTHAFEDLHLEKSAAHMMDNLVLGFNEGVEVGMPNDEFERSSVNEENKFAISQIPTGTVEEQGSLDGQTRQPVDGSTTVSIESSSKNFQETDMAMQDLIIQPKRAPQSSASSELVDHLDSSSSSGFSMQPQVPSSSSQAAIPSVLNQPEVPVKLQFGLFSGPSLIPSPVSAIQIGSIQMPLHLHPPVGPSLSHMHPSQSPLFQFGELRYTSPTTQGVLPLGPQSVSFIPSNVPVNFSFNQNSGDQLPIQPCQDTSACNVVQNNAISISMDSQPALLPRHMDLSHNMVSKDGNLLSSRENADNTVAQKGGDISHIGGSNSRPELGIQAEESFLKNFKNLKGKPQAGDALTQSILKEKEVEMSKSQGVISSGRGRRYVFSVKNSGSRSPLQAPEASRPDSGGYQRRRRRQRTEFRVWENADKGQSTGLVLSDLYGVDEKSNISSRGTGARNGSRRVVVPNRLPKMASESLSAETVNSQEVHFGSRGEKGAGKEFLKKSQNLSHSGDVDAPLQSGIVRVFEQPGIEAPSDDEDFIEVRSKRQMLNDRREQREKEIKAKSRVSKMPRKLRYTSQSNSASITSSKLSASVAGEATNSIRPDVVATEEHGLANTEVSAGFSAPMVSQPLPPIGTPAVKTDVQADTRSQTIKSIQPSSLPVVSGGRKTLASGLIFENKNKVSDNVQTSLGSWGSSRINQQVTVLTQTQHDEALKPGQFDSCSSLGDNAKSISESSLQSSILIKDKSFSSTASPINSLLAGEKIQFGAVTSPTILPPSTRALSHGIGPPGPSRADIQISHNLSTAENDCSLFFDQEKHSGESCAHLEDSEAEAEAAASAVAVAAIVNDEIIGSGLGTGPVPAAGAKSFGSADIDGITADISGDQQLAGQSRSEESLSVALPADLSVENPPMSLWPPLPSPQNSSSQMLSPVPGGPPSHFPFYEMNPMLGGPIFTFGPADESASIQSHSQKSTPSVSGPPGTWQHHSGVDSFYGPPAGFTGPFISPPGSIPAVQGPPHMVVYNHFTPVGQFGQVGLSFMGTTYIPSGKQPDWKHNPASSMVGVGEGDMVSVQRNPTNVPAHIQHLAPGSPLLPMPSPLAMFDVSPFQSSPDMSVQHHWSHVPPSPLQSVPVSMQLQHQAEGGVPSQFSHVPPVDQPLTANRFPESRVPSSASDNGQKFPVNADAAVSQLPDELGLVEASNSSTTATTLAQGILGKSSSADIIPATGKVDAVNSPQNASSALKAQPSHQKTTSNQNYNNSSGYNYQRGSGVSQKGSSGNEWSHRRMGNHGRNQSVGAEKSFPSSKMKQIYVAKQTTSGTPKTQ